MSKMSMEYGYYQSGARGWRRSGNAWDRRYGRTEAESMVLDSMELINLTAKVAEHSAKEEPQKTEIKER